MPSPQQHTIDSSYMELALESAATALHFGEVPIGAVIVLGENILATTHNDTRTRYDPTGHAEISALRQAAQSIAASRLDGATLYVTVEPCLMCAGALLQARIDRLVFGARETRTGGVVSIADTLMNPANTHHVSVTEGVLADRAAELMWRFFSDRR